MPAVNNCDDQLDPAWSESTARKTCIAACQEADLQPIGQPSLIRLGTNAVFEVKTASGPVVAVRVAPSDYDSDLLSDQLRLADWLCEAGFPTSRPIRREITWIDSRPVTFWAFLDGRPGTDADRCAFGRLLSSYHAITNDYRGRLPEWEPLGRLGRRLDIACVDDAFSTDDRELLCGWRDRLTDGVSELEFVLPKGPLHGDVSTGNVIVVDSGLYLVDLDRIARGPREWDLSTILASQEFFGAPGETVDDFMTGYGWDLRGFAGAHELTRLRALFMTSWLITLPRTPPVKEEIANRMRFWRDPSEAHVWHPV